MPAPTTPTVNLTRSSSTSFVAACTGDSGGTTYTLRYRRIGTDLTTVGGTRTNPGNISVGGLALNGSYLVWVVCSNGELSLPYIGFVSLVEPDTVAMAIKAKWDLLPSLVETAGPLFTQEVAENLDGTDVTFPYSWINIGKSFFDWTFEIKYFENTEVDFYIHCNGLEDAELASTLFRTHFDWGSLTFQDSVNTKCLIAAPTDYQLAKDPIPDKDGNPVYTCKISFHITVERHLSI